MQQVRLRPLGGPQIRKDGGLLENLIVGLQFRSRQGFLQKCFKRGVKAFTDASFIWGGYISIKGASIGKHSSWGCICLESWPAGAIIQVQRDWQDPAQFRRAGLGTKVISQHEETHIHTCGVVELVWGPRKLLEGRKTQTDASHFCFQAPPFLLQSLPLSSDSSWKTEFQGHIANTGHRPF